MLRAGRATLPLGEAGEILALDEKQAALLRGPRADPAAHLFLRPYVKRAGYIAIAEPSDGVPYWLVSTRHPDRAGGRAAGGRRRGGREAPAGRAAAPSGNPWDDCAITQGGEEATDE